MIPTLPRKLDRPLDFILDLIFDRTLDLTLDLLLAVTLTVTVVLAAFLDRISILGLCLTPLCQSHHYYITVMCVVVYMFL